MREKNKPECGTGNDSGTVEKVKRNKSGTEGAGTGKRTGKRTGTKTGRSVKKRNKITVPFVLSTIWAAVCVTIIRLVIWVFNNFGSLQMDEIMYTLTSSLTGTNPALIRSLYIEVIPWPFLTAAVYIFLHLRVLRKARLRKMFTMWAMILLSAAMVGSLVYSASKIKFVQYLQNSGQSSTFIADNYVDPYDVEITFPKKKRNLIYIYLESMEIAYSDVESGGASKVDIIPELTELGLKSEMFGDDNQLNGGYALFGTTYTMGGIFAQTAGLPLTLTNQVISSTEGFMPGLHNLGDILDKNGYRNVFCIGTEARFGERDIYFSTHGNYEIWDFGYSIKEGEIPADYKRGWWGYDDYILYKNCKKHLKELASGDQPFNFTMLTVDTHSENGYICKICPDTFGKDRYSNTLACASKQCAEFLDWIQKQDFYENTTVIISGDHCTLDSDYFKKFTKGYDRRVYTVFLNSPVEPEIKSRRDFSTMDYFPTTLAAMGAKIKGEKLGLGTNLYSDRNTLTEVYGHEWLDQELQKSTDFFDGLLGEKIVRHLDVEYDGEDKLKMKYTEPIDFDKGYKAVYYNILTSKGVIRVDVPEMKEPYEAEFSLKEHNVEDGEVVVELYLLMDDGLPYWYCDEKVNLVKE